MSTERQLKLFFDGTPMREVVVKLQGTVRKPSETPEVARNTGPYAAWRERTAGRPRLLIVLQGFKLRRGNE